MSSIKQDPKFLDMTGRIERDAKRLINLGVDQETAVKIAAAKVCREVENEEARKLQLKQGSLRE
ncbi:MAG: hypothetical protein OXE92_09150 [Bacteroidetes bacterium]|nr:hypothetical protein [Bacteroidota bacterium]MCY4205875.1 hypothetical protein [Bacteroidota bacterium]